MSKHKEKNFQKGYKADTHDEIEWGDTPIHQDSQAETSEDESLEEKDKKEKKKDVTDDEIQKQENEKKYESEEDQHKRLQARFNALSAVSGTFFIGHLVSVSLLHGGTSSISVLSSATQDWLLSPEGTAIVFVAPVVLAAIVGLIAWTATNKRPAQYYYSKDDTVDDSAYMRTYMVFEDVNNDGKKPRTFMGLLAVSGTFFIGELVSVSLLHGGTSSISVLSSATQDWLLSPEGTAIVFVAPVVLAAIVGIIVWAATKPKGYHLLEDS